jgi:hypothetical protein
LSTATRALEVTRLDDLRAPPPCSRLKDYHAVPLNGGALEAFRTQIIGCWQKALRRRKPERPVQLGADLEPGRRMAAPAAYP